MRGFVICTQLRVMTNDWEYLPRMADPINAYEILFQGRRLIKLAGIKDVGRKVILKIVLKK
jgi:hypothetical protein